MASVAEMKAAIDAAMLHVQESQEAVRAATDKLGEAQLGLALAVGGSANVSVNAARAALAQAADELDECLTTTLAAVDQAQIYGAGL